MADLRKIVIIFAIAILFSVFSYSLGYAIYPQPEYTDFCNERPAPVQLNKRDVCESFIVPEEEAQSCHEQKGTIRYIYDGNGCAVDYECSMCNANYNTSREKHDFFMFVFISIMALLAIVLGLHLPKEQNSLNEWIGTGFMLGGVFILFLSTMQFFSELHRIVRPIIILVEMVIIIHIAYKKMVPKPKAKK